MALIEQTRRQLRQRVADVFGDLRTITATANGSTTTFVDTFNVNTGTEDYRKCEILFTSGANNGLASVVTATNQTTGTLTFTPARTATVANDTAELYKMRGTGFSLAEYHRAINNAIHELHGVALIPSIVNIVPTFDATTQTFVAPASLTEVYRVEYKDRSDTWNEIRPALRKGESGWTAEPDDYVRIEGYDAWMADGRPLRVWGYGIQNPLTDDDSVCLYSAEAVVAIAAANLCQSRIDREPKYSSLLLTLLKRAEDARAGARVIREPQPQMVNR
jgi:hypothetical protein